MKGIVSANSGVKKKGTVRKAAKPSRALKPSAPPCPRCKGTGWYMYDHNHSVVCDRCCKHDKGWWKLPMEGYGNHGGKWCCKGGCGAVMEKRP